ncbi:hypothetical protein [Streptomyces sp. NPDC002547]
MTEQPPGSYSKTCLPVDDWLSHQLVKSGITGERKEALVHVVREKFKDAYREFLDDLLSEEIPSLLAQHKVAGKDLTAEYTSTKNVVPTVHEAGLTALEAIEDFGGAVENTSHRTAVTEHAGVGFTDRSDLPVQIHAEPALADPMREHAAQSEPAQTEPAQDLPARAKTVQGQQSFETTSPALDARNALTDVSEEDRSTEVPSSLTTSPSVVYPWYIDYGALGDAEVRDVPEWSLYASLHAKRIAEGIVDKAIRQALEPVLQDILGLSDPKQWTELLATGQMIVAQEERNFRTASRKEHLVWVRPVLAQVRRTAAGSGHDPVIAGVTDGGTALASEQVPVGWLPEGDREFRAGTHFNSASGSVTKTATAHSWMQVAVNIAAATQHAATVPVTVQVGIASARTKGQGSGQTIKSVHRVQPEWSNFSAGEASVRFRVFVDGHELTLGDAAIVPRRLGVVFSPGLPATVTKPAETSIAPHQSATQRPPRTPLFLNALDTVPIVAGLQRNLLAAKLPATAVRDVMTKLASHLDERQLRQHATWILSSGLVTGPIEVPITSFGKKFQGSFTIRAGLESLQFLGLSAPDAMRGLGGIATSSNSLNDGFSRVDANVGPLMTGLVNHAVANADAFRITGRVPDIRLLAFSQRSAGVALSSSAARHTEFKTTKPAITYATELGTSVSVTSSTHQVSNVLQAVHAEVATPWRGQAQAADFEERVLGEVHTPAFRSADAVDELLPALRTGPVDAQPHVRALLRQSGLPMVRDHQRPALMDQPLPAPHHREPLELASRKGGGFSTTLHLPGAELIQENFLAALKGDVLRRGKNITNWTSIDHDLAVNFGRPALEQRLGRLTTGFWRTIWVGDLAYQLYVRGHLRERIGGDTTGFDAESVIGYGSNTTGHRGERHGIRFTGGTGGVLRLPNVYTLQIGSISAFGERSWGNDTSFSTGGRTSRRTKPTGNDEHIYNIVYELQLIPLKSHSDKNEVLRKPKPATTSLIRTFLSRSDRRPEPQSWWLHRQEGLEAQVFVPQAYIPKSPITAKEATEAGRAYPLASWPNWQRAQYNISGTSSIVPGFIPIPELAKLAATLYAQLNNLEPGFAENPQFWPSKIQDLRDPDSLNSAFSNMVSRFGHLDEMANRHGYKQGLRIRLRTYALTDLGAVAPRHGVTDVQDSTKSLGTQTGTSTEFGGSFITGIYPTAAGPLPGQNSLYGNRSQQSELSAVGGGHLYLQGRMWGSKSWNNATREEAGYAKRTKAIYSSLHQVHAVAVFEVTAIRWKGSTTEEHAGYLCVEDGLQLQMAPRVLEDLTSSLTTQPAVDTAAAAGGQVAVAIPATSAMQDTTPTLPVRLERDYLTSGIAGSAGRAENIQADDVINVITETLKKHDIKILSSTGAVRPDTLNRTLIDLFDSDKLKNHIAALVSTGLWTWLPIPGAAGTTNYLWIRVRAGEMEIPYQYRTRPDVTLSTTITANSSTQQEKNISKSYGVDAQFQIGAFHSSGRDGGEANGGYRTTSGLTTSHARSEANINDTDYKGKSEEFTHKVTFHIEIGHARELPQIFDLPGRLTMAGARKIGQLTQNLLNHPETFRDFVHKPGIWSWFEKDIRAYGDIRLLVPTSLTQPTGTRHVAPLYREYGQSPQWTAPPAPPRLPEQLLSRMQALGMPAASAIERWAAIAASTATLDPSLSNATAWTGPGVAFNTTTGPTYAHYTSADMLEAHLAQLLQRTYAVRVGNTKVVVGFHLDHARLLNPPHGAPHQDARYTKIESETIDSRSKNAGWYTNTGPIAVHDTAGPSITYTNAIGGYGRSYTYNTTSRLSDNDENTRTGKVPHSNVYYQFDLTITFTGPKRTLSVKAPNGLLAKLPLNADGQLPPDVHATLTELLATHEHSLTEINKESNILTGSPEIAPRLSRTRAPRTTRTAERYFSQLTTITEQDETADESAEETAELKAKDSSHFGAKTSLEVTEITAPLTHFTENSTEEHTPTAQQEATPHTQTTEPDVTPVAAFLDRPRSAAHARGLTVTGGEPTDPSVASHGADRALLHQSSLHRADDTNAVSHNFHPRFAPAVRYWSRDVSSEIDNIEQLLLREGPGSRSLVMRARPEGPLWAVNIGGTVVWKDHITLDTVRAPQYSTENIASIDLNPASQVIGALGTSLQHEGLANRFCELGLGADLDSLLGVNTTHFGGHAGP